MEKKENKVYNLSDIIGDDTQLAQKNFFCVGDWVYIPAMNEKGKVIGWNFDKQWEEDSITLRMQDGRELKVLESNCKPIDYGPKTAFLTELSELLQKYDASVRAEIIGFEGLLPSMSLLIGNEQFYFPGQREITANNVLNYDKE